MPSSMLLCIFIVLPTNDCQNAPTLQFVEYCPLISTFKYFKLLNTKRILSFF